MAPSVFPATRAIAADVASLDAEADKLALHAERGWDVLLFMRDRSPFRGRTSVVDSAEFFLAGEDDWSPQKELHATVRAMIEAPIDDAEKANTHPQCRFPARRRWLVEHLPGFREALPPLKCELLDAWLLGLETESVSLVFSSYFANNPASTFGHSFMRLHKRLLPGRPQSDLLDDSVNFMAYPTTDNPILYMVMGLLGRFPGRFSITPFYMKIQEYNNGESRDLWDYQLAFDKDDIDRLHLVLWEMGPHAINYFYFDENCSFILLTVLEAAKPSLHLAPLHPWVIPSDTLRVVNYAPGLVASVTYRPSALTRFLTSYRDLSDEERGLVDLLVDANDPEQAETYLHFVDGRTAARVIDVVVEFIDYDEKLAGSKEATTHAALRKSLLLKRADLRQPRTLPQPTLPENESPHLVRGTTRIGGGLGYDADRGGFAEAVWRPALHDLGSPDLGYSEGLEITFFDTVVRYLAKDRKAYLHRFDPLTILSVPHLPWITRPFAWSLEVGADNRDACTKITAGCYTEHLRGGIGPVLNFDAGRLYALAKAEAGASGDAALETFAGFGGTVGGLLPLSPRHKLSFRATKMRRFGPDRATGDYDQGAIEGSVLVTNSFELTATMARTPAGAAELLLSAYHYQ